MNALAAVATLPARRRLGTVVDSCGARGWEPLRIARRDGGTLVVALGPRSGDVEAIAKIAGPGAAAAVRAEAAALAALAPVAADGDWLWLLPELLAAGDVAGGAYVVQRALPGVDGRRLVVAGRPPMQVVRAAVDAVAAVHAAARPTAVDDATVESWAAEPCGLVARILGGGRRTARLRLLAAELAAVLAGRTVRAGWMHGDFWLGNVLLDSDSERVTGIVDWDRAADRHPVHLDLLHLLLYGRAVRGGRPFGHVVRAALESPPWNTVERAVLQTYGDPPLLGDGARAGILLMWLRHVSQNLRQSPRYALAPLWVRQNVDSVLRAL